MTFRDWERRLLVGLGSEYTHERWRFLVAWARAEGGTASNNPLNTTMPASGSTRYNSAGVRNYVDDIEGLAATLLTLRLPYYRKLVAALKAPNLTAEQILSSASDEISKWGTSPATIHGVLRSTH